MRVTVLHNPTAGEESHSGDGLVSALERAGHRATYYSTKDKEHKEILKDPAALGDAVVVAGGDGTIGKVMMRLAGCGVPVAVLPLGTANNIAGSLGVRWSAEELAGGLHAARRAPFDIGRVEAPWGPAAFVESAGLGLFTRMVALPSAERFKEVAEARIVLRYLLADQPATFWRIELDGCDLSGEYVLVEALNIPCFGPNLRLAPSAEPGDGLLDVVLAGESERRVLVQYLAELRDGDDGPPPLPVHRGRRLRVVADPDHVHLDDDPEPEEVGRGSLCALEISLREGALELLLPAE
jgi:diacylglycerol kinase family enzyme